MLAVYPSGGAKFTKHIDNTARDGRRLTVLCYLNVDERAGGKPWDTTHGGALRVHAGGLQGAASAVHVMPVCGRLAMFYADSMPHEVESCFRERHALTLWYYDKLERAEAAATAQISQGRGGDSVDGRARLEAQAMIRDMMAVSSPEEDPSVEECIKLGQRVRELSQDALRIVASIVG